jgi:uroporphyrinogen-III decarboxylase
VDLTGKERMETVLKGGVPDVCPVAPVFWGAEYVWKVTGKSLLEQMHGKDPGSPEAALRLCARHPADWILLTVTDGDGWLEGKQVSVHQGRTFIHDPATKEDFEFDSAGHLLRKPGEPPQSIRAQARTEVTSRKDVERLFPHPKSGQSEKDKTRVSHVVGKVGKKIFVCASEISPFVDACYRLGAETAMQKLAEDSSLFLYAADISLEIQRARIHNLRDTGAHGVLIAESYASCDMISPEQYRRCAFPYQKEMIKIIHECGMYAVLLSTGNLMPILADITELDADALIVEESRKGWEMEIGHVREAYGPGKCLFGNVSSERLLGAGDIHGTYRETFHQIESAGKQGCFVVSNGASPICDTTHPVAIDIMIEASHLYRY